MREHSPRHPKQNDIASALQIKHTSTGPIAENTRNIFCNRGIIEPADDIRSTTPPLNPTVFDALPKDFIDHKFDVRHLLKRIVTQRWLV